MLSFQAISYCEYMLEQLENLQPFFDELSQYSSDFSSREKEISGIVFVGASVSLSSSSATYVTTNNRTNYKEKYVNGFESFKQNFDFFELSKKWHLFQSNIEGYFKESDLSNDDYLLNSFSESMNIALKGFQSYYQSPSGSNSLKLSYNIETLCKNYSDLITCYHFTLNMLSPTIIEANNDNTVFSLQLLQINLTTEEFAYILNKFDKIYNQLSVVYEDSERLDIVKIESSSLHGMFKGALEKIKMIKTIFKPLVKAYYDIFSKKGVLMTTREAIAVVKEASDVEQLLAERGLDTLLARENIEKSFAIVAKDMFDIVRMGSPIIVIDETKYGIQEAVKERYLASVEKPLLTATNDAKSTESEEQI